MNKLLNYFGQPRFNLLDIVVTIITTNFFSSGQYLTDVVVLVSGLIFAALIQTFVEN